MDKATLVRSDLDTEGRVLNALSLAKIPATLVDLDYVSSLEEWQLVIATPLYDDKGPREAYSRVIKALQDADIYEDVPIRRVSLKSPSDPSVKALMANVQAKTEGAIHILELGRSDQSQHFSVIFAPFSGPGGPIPSRRFRGRDRLRQFLEDEIGIARSSVEEALSEIYRRGSASIFYVQLSRREVKRLGLA